VPPASPSPTVAAASASPGSSARCAALTDVQLSPTPSVELENNDSPPPAWEARPSFMPPTVPVPERGPPDDGQCAHLPCRSPTFSAVTRLWFLATSTIFDLSALRTRAEAMVISEGERPAASRIDAVAGKATLRRLWALSLLSEVSLQSCGPTGRTMSNRSASVSQSRRCAGFVHGSCPPAHASSSRPQILCLAACCSQWPFGRAAYRPHAARFHRKMLRVIVRCRILSKKVEHVG